MADVLQTIIQIVFSWMKTSNFKLDFIEIVLSVLLDSTSIFMQIIAWGLTGAKPLPEPMLTQMFDIIWPHYATMS